eukprot:CAMPEP_0185193922 /NCGR_PEP_ID=MMETSP1140-20130426/28356_1 /TAXON_ID=298111 /ORGANISM="Pavlova sp., Strain CCMP459" /LENGTH=89 /DNA_ID=CAMNT_0027760797 /DNA_START=179 /DNA_END=444 /DNA_ORIENTATION=+
MTLSASDSGQETTSLNRFVTTNNWPRGCQQKAAASAMTRTSHYVPCKHKRQSSKVYDKYHYLLPAGDVRTPKMIRCACGVRVSGNRDRT